MPHTQRRPRENDFIAFQAGMDEKGRPRAIQANIVGKGWSLFTKIWMVSILVFAVYVCCVFAHILRFHPLAIYALMSLLTVQQYSIDKAEARAKRWRTSEAHLHFFELAGGWPGALFAQYFYRHKNRKLSYQMVFWLIVLLHGVSWAWVLSHPDVVNEYKNIIFPGAQAQHHEGRPQQPNRTAEEMPMPQEEPPRYRSQTALESRPRVIVKKDKRIIEGIIAEVNPVVGIVVTLPAQFEGNGIIDKSVLDPDFANQFIKGDAVQVTIKTISMKGSVKRIELALADD
jgi:uncharacterized membrane protein YsdA (DUF1294 family)